MQNFPDAQGVRKLQRLGIRTVVLVPELAHVKLPPHKFQTAEPPDPITAAAKPIAGRPVTRRRDGPLVIYTIEPPGTVTGRPQPTPAGASRAARRAAHARGGARRRANARAAHASAAHAGKASHG